MTVLLAYAGAGDLAVVAVLLLLVLPALLWAMLHDRGHEPMRRHELPPRPVEPRSNVRPIARAPRPYDWQTETHFTPAEIARLLDVPAPLLGEVFVAPVGTVIDETFPHGPEWSSLGRIEDDGRRFLFESTTARRP